ncbi:MAG: YfhO family protein [Caldilineaceae bacterium]|nr:YfhO family protein [Caldilineaceae bacterium]
MSELSEKVAVTPKVVVTPNPSRSWLWEIVVALLLAIFVMLLYARLLFTNRVLASGDILLYFYPYRDYAAAALRSGEIPLWNPYIFLGVPFLANPQAAVLYPLHWPLSWLPVTTQVYWSAALHTWLLGLGGYLLMRLWGRSRWAGLITGLVLAGSGFYGGLIGHLNQMNGAAWLPWALAVLVWAGQGEPGERIRWARALRAAGLFGLLVALMLLAGHTQTVYINLFGLAVWVVWPLVGRAGGFFAALRMTGKRLLVYGVGVVVGALAAAPQLLPTLELSARGLRQGGLGYGEVSSFSLQPLRLPWTLLPSYGLVDLGVVFGTSGYTEFVAYVGIFALLLAALGIWRGRGAAWTSGLLLAALGLFLAAGRWNPFYYLLYWIVPGFDLFRAPARWMMLYTLGMAILAGIGLDRWPRRRMSVKIAGVALVGLVALDLILAARALPHTQTTAPQAVYEIRTALAHLLTDPARDALHPAAAGRFLGMSSITYDPGDMADYARLLRDGPTPQLDARAFDQLIIALKVQELLAPNLALLWRVPSLDGFDGGVLPLARYLDFLTLFVPPDQLIPDGRLREQVKRMPSADLLAIFNVQYVITDKVADLWFEDVYYDRQIGAQLNADLPTVTVDAPRPFPATHLHLIATAEGDDAALAGANRPVLTVSVTGVDATGETVTVQLPVLAGDEPGAQLADAQLDSPLAERNGALVAYRDVEGERQEYRVSLELPAVLTPDAITLTWQPDAPPITVQAATLVDARTGMFTALLPSDRGRFQLAHSGDVKIYENLDLLPRAYLVHRVLTAADADQAVAQVAAADFDPADAAVVEGLDAFRTTASPGDGAALLDYAPERVLIESHSAEPALLVLSDGDDPGWHATVDGAPVPIYRTNVLLRGVEVPAGRHRVEFVYRPAPWQQGLWVGAVGLVLIAGLLVGGRDWRRKPQAPPSPPRAKATGLRCDAP